jgi:hypothetical protein
MGGLREHALTLKPQSKESLHGGTPSVFTRCSCCDAVTKSSASAQRPVGADHEPAHVSIAWGFGVGSRRGTSPRGR